MPLFALSTCLLTLLGSSHVSLIQPVFFTSHLIPPCHFAPLISHTEQEVENFSTILGKKRKRETLTKKVMEHLMEDHRLMRVTKRVQDVENFSAISGKGNGERLREELMGHLMREGHMMRVSKRGEEENQMMRVSKREEEEQGPREDHMMRVSKRMPQLFWNLFKSWRPYKVKLSTVNTYLCLYGSNQKV